MFSFQKQPKKYALVLPERNPELIRKPVGEVLKPFDLEKCPKSRLPEEVQVAMKAMVSWFRMQLVYNMFSDCFKWLAQLLRNTKS